ncbi:YceI family protein [Haloferula sp. A504]|uniref:YceI family protein n=1 Tax=Haloferula sp. A504 TaxID=3373601 RepID=UPI0031BE603E|nr:YceI family protein [Verrucomicrobiaceae bacterium E54]
MKTIDSRTLQAALDGKSPPKVLDVRLADDFGTAHIPGATNNCVFEVAFHERLREAAPDPNRPTVLCGATDDSHEARMAAEKLERGGYTDLAILDGGLAAWRAAGMPVEEGAPLASAPEPPDGRRELDLDECRLQWLGRNLLNKHFGTIRITAGHLDFSGGTLSGGEFTFDLRSLRCDDLDGDPLHDVLIGHLLDHDFLDADAHPECRLVITAAETLPDTAPGQQNLRIEANLTLRGVTEPVAFTAAAGLTPEGRAAAQASFAIDRTRWGILYGSGRFFHRLAGHLVNDLIDFDVRIVTT